MALNAWDTRRITYAAMMDSVQPILSYYPHPSPQNVMDMDSGSLRTNNYTGTHIPWPAQQRNYSTCDTYTTPIKQELNSNTEEFPEYNSVPNNLFNTIPLTPSPESVRTEHHFQENRTVPTANPVCYDNQLTPPDCTPNSNTLRTCLYRTNENQTEQRTPVRSIVSLIETPSNSPTLSAGNHENPCKDDEAVSNIEAGSDEKLYSDEDDLDGIYVRQFNSHGKMRTYKCKKCSLVMDTRAELWRHLETHLDASKILRCPKAPKCPFVTVLKHYLEYHIRHHNQEKPYECSKCNYRCINKSMLNSHMKSHSGLYQYSCKDCDYATKYCHSLKVHLRKYMHEPGLVLDEDGVPDPTIIIDVNGRRRGPRGKKGRVSRELKPQLSAISQAPKEEDDLKDDSSVSEEPQKSQATKVPSTPEKSPLPPSTHPYLPAPTFNPGIVQNTLPNPLMNLFQQNLHLLPYLQALFIQRNNFLSTLSSGPPMPIKYPMEDRDGASAMDLSQNSPDKLEKWENNHSDSAEENSTSNLTWQNGKEPHHKDYDYEDQKIRQSTPAATPTSTPTPPPISSPSSTDLQGIHHCPHCDIFFKNVILFSLHMGYHTCGDVFKCNMCGERCENAVQFSIHLAVKRHDTSNM